MPVVVAAAVSAAEITSRSNFDWRAVGSHPPKFCDLFVGQRDAAGSPILPAEECADPSMSIREAMNNEVSTGGNTPLFGARVVLLRGIGNVQC
jgi:hypothetical protein